MLQRRWLFICSTSDSSFPGIRATENLYKMTIRPPYLSGESFKLRLRGWIENPEAFRERANSVAETMLCPGRLGERYTVLTWALTDTRARQRGGRKGVQEGLE